MPAKKLRVPDMKIKTKNDEPRSEQPFATQSNDPDKPMMNVKQPQPPAEKKPKKKRAPTERNKLVSKLMKEGKSMAEASKMASKMLPPKAKAKK